MTVQELFKSINEDEFLDLYLRNDTETLDLIFNNKISFEEKERKLKKFKEIVLNALHLFRTMKIEKDDKYIVFAIPEYDGDALAHSFLVKRKEILYPESIDRIETYAYEFSPHKEVLSYDISKACRYETDNDVCLAVSIFNEMTFCGITEESHSDKVDEIRNEINETIDEIEKGTDNFITSDMLFEKLGWEDNRTKEEKEFSLEIEIINGKATSEIYNKYFAMEKYYLNK